MAFIGVDAGGRRVQQDAVGGQQREVSAVPDGPISRLEAFGGRELLVSAAAVPAASWRPSAFTWAAHQPVWPSIR